MEERTELQKKKYEFAESISLEPVFNKLREMVDMPNLKFTSSIKEDRYGNPRISFESEDIADKTGFLKYMFKELRIASFASVISLEPLGAPFTYYGTANFTYIHPDGGSNGYGILSYSYIDGEWEIHD